ncbi:MAG TPA: hypothetical protein VFN23_18620 [Ktedonobacteraceae bacterium]|nr:hypothetical protein [Ktedonobacteraceae bacterium]
MIDTKVKTRRWSELYHSAVTIPSEGRQVGILEDFFFEPDSSLIRALLIRDTMQQERALANYYILEIEQKTITISNADALIERLPNLPTGHKLLNLPIVGESGEEVGVVGEIMIGVVPTIAIRIAALTLPDYRSGILSGPKHISANNIVRYEQERIVIFDQVARRL